MVLIVDKSSEKKSEMWKKGRSIVKKCCGPLFLVLTVKEKHMLPLEIMADQCVCASIYSVRVFE